MFCEGFGALGSYPSCLPLPCTSVCCCQAVAVAAAAEMGEYGVAPGQHVAVIWDSSSPAAALKDLVDKIQAVVGADNRVSVENINQLSQCKNDPNFSLLLLKGKGTLSYELTCSLVCKSAFRAAIAPTVNALYWQCSKDSDIPWSCFLWLVSFTSYCCYTQAWELKRNVELIIKQRFVRVCMENCTILRLSFFAAAHKESSFDVILSGMVPGSTVQHTTEVLAEIARILKPGGRVLLKEPVVTESGERICISLAFVVTEKFLWELVCNERHQEHWPPFRDFHSPDTLTWIAFF